MATNQQQAQWTVAAVGTERNRSVLFLTRPHPQGGIEQRTVPTDLVSMTTLAATGAPIRNA